MHATEAKVRVTIEAIFHAATWEECLRSISIFSSFRETSCFLTVCVFNILDAVGLMTSAMIKPWPTAAITRNGRRMTADLDALIVVRIF